MLQGVPFNALRLPEPGASWFCKELLRWTGMTPALLSFNSQTPTWPHLPLCLGPALCLACWGGVLALASPPLDAGTTPQHLGPHTWTGSATHLLLLRPGHPNAKWAAGAQQGGSSRACAPGGFLCALPGCCPRRPSQPPGGTDGLLINLLIFKIFWLHCTRLVGSEITDRGPNLCPLMCKYGVLTTGLPGESQGLMVLGLQAGIDVVSKTL